jgi:hypothetical protein
LEPLRLGTVRVPVVAIGTKAPHPLNWRVGSKLSAAVDFL